MVCFVLRVKIKNIIEIVVLVFEKKNETFCLMFLLEKVSRIGKGFVFLVRFY